EENGLHGGTGHPGQGPCCPERRTLHLGARRLVPVDMAAEILVVAGEASGDQHAAAVVREIRRRAPEVRFFGMGGARLAAEGVDLLYRAEEISVMGVVEV